jgi:hypothetical protein
LQSRSVHNVRIERLWCDVTAGFGAKWKQFFQDLELHDGLMPDVEAHVWLLHHLFLPSINEDALEWAESWNQHTMAIRGERQRSPLDMFYFGMIEQGVRGFSDCQEPVDEEVDDPASYGIDWGDLNNSRILHHHQQENLPDAIGNDNPFLTHQPHEDQLTQVIVPEAGCPLSADQLHYLNVQLDAQPDIESKSMHSRRLLWIVAHDLCRQMFTS